MIFILGKSNGCVSIYLTLIYFFQWSYYFDLFTLPFKDNQFCYLGDLFFIIIFLTCLQEEHLSSEPLSVQAMSNEIEVQTAPLSDGVLPGIMRQIVIEVCHDLGIPVGEVSPSWSERELWEEAFVTSSLRLIQHVETIQVPSVWEDIDSKTWNDVSWVVKQFQGAGCITTQIQRKISERAIMEEYNIANLCELWMLSLFLGDGCWLHHYMFFGGGRCQGIAAWRCILLSSQWAVMSVVVSSNSKRIPPSGGHTNVGFTSGTCLAVAPTWLWRALPQPYWGGPMGWGCCWPTQETASGWHHQHQINPPCCPRVQAASTPNEPSRPSGWAVGMTHGSHRVPVLRGRSQGSTPQPRRCWPCVWPCD